MCPKSKNMELQLWMAGCRRGTRSCRWAATPTWAAVFPRSSWNCCSGAGEGAFRHGSTCVPQINGIPLEGREHKHVVDLFKTAGEDVELLIQKKVGGFWCTNIPPDAFPTVSWCRCSWRLRRSNRRSRSRSRSRQPSLWESCLCWWEPRRCLHLFTWEGPGRAFNSRWLLLFLKRHQDERCWSEQTCGRRLYFSWLVSFKESAHTLFVCWMYMWHPCSWARALGRPPCTLEQPFPTVWSGSSAPQVCSC